MNHTQGTCMEQEVPIFHAIVKPFVQASWAILRHFYQLGKYFQHCFDSLKWLLHFLVQDSKSSGTSKLRTLGCPDCKHQRWNDIQIMERFIWYEWRIFISIATPVQFQWTRFIAWQHLVCFDQQFFFSISLILISKFQKNSCQLFYVLHRPRKQIWHGSNINGDKSIESFCATWETPGGDKTGMAGSLSYRRLINNEKVSCKDELIVLCIETIPREEMPVIEKN